MYIDFWIFLSATFCFPVVFFQYNYVITLMKQLYSNKIMCNNKVGYISNEYVLYITKRWNMSFYSQRNTTKQLIVYVLFHYGSFEILHKSMRCHEHRETLT
jgi:hypothetical protein